MLIDASIYGRQRTPDYMGQALRGYSAGQMMQERRREDDLRRAYASGLVQDDAGNYGYDPQKAVNVLAGKGFGREAMALQMQGQEEQRKDVAANLDAYKKKLDIVSSALGNTFDEPSWEAAKADLEAKGIGAGPIKNMPWSEDNKYRAMNMALSTREQLEMQMKEREFGLKEQEYGIKTTQKQRKFADDLRKERSGLPTTKATQEVSAAFNKVQKAAEEPSAAGDLSLIFNYMKMLDPGSVVREGEFANAQNAAGVPTRVQNLYNRVISGERLSGMQRGDFMKQAGKVYSAQKAVQDRVDKSFMDLAQKRGIDPKDVFLEFGAEPYKARKRGPVRQKEPRFNLLSDIPSLIEPAQAGKGTVLRTDEIEWAD